MKPASCRWYRQEPKAPHVDDAVAAPVKFYIKVRAFGFYFADDRIRFEHELEQCNAEHYEQRCQLVSGHGGLHDAGEVAWNEHYMSIPAPGRFGPTQVKTDTQRN